MSVDTAVTAGSMTWQDRLYLLWIWVIWWPWLDLESSLAADADLLWFVARSTGRCRTTTKCSTGSTATRVSSRQRRVTHRLMASCHSNTITSRYVIVSSASAPLKVADITPVYICTILLDQSLGPILQWLSQFSTRKPSYHWHTRIMHLLASCSLF